MAELELHEQQELERRQFARPTSRRPSHGTRVTPVRARRRAARSTARWRRYGAYRHDQDAGVRDGRGHGAAVCAARVAEPQRARGARPTGPVVADARGSPSTWPEDANHPHGAPLRSTQRMLRCSSPDFRFPTHCVGHEAPHAGDAHYERMRSRIRRTHARSSSRSTTRKRGRRQEIRYNQEKLAHWKESLHFEPLSSKMDHAFVKVSTKRARELTILHTPEFSSASRFQEQTAKLTEKRRQQFWELLQREYGAVELQCVNRLFSSYDCSMEDRIDMRLFLGTVRALRVQQGTPLEILALCLQDFDKTKQQVVTSVATFLTVTTMCCASDDEEQEMDALASKTWHEMCRQ
ncbi:hypothetical protein PINS_up022702 [Pythium insidiosum]|nr:hypothetical protein PINS_up022702 [Pythium insidiosum]